MGLFMWSVSAVFNILGPFSWELEACKIQAHVPKELVGLMLGVTSFLVLFPFSVPQVTQEAGRVIPFFHQWGSTWLADPHTHRLMCLKTVRAGTAGTTLFIPWGIFHQTSYFVHSSVAYTLALKYEVWHQSYNIWMFFIYMHASVDLSPGDLLLWVFPTAMTGLYKSTHILSLHNTYLWELAGTRVKWFVRTGREALTLACELCWSALSTKSWKEALAN